MCHLRVGTATRCALAAITLAITHWLHLRGCVLKLLPLLWQEVFVFNSATLAFDMFVFSNLRHFYKETYTVSAQQLTRYICIIDMVADLGSRYPTHHPTSSVEERCQYD